MIAWPCLIVSTCSLHLRLKKSGLRSLASSVLCWAKRESRISQCFLLNSNIDNLFRSVSVSTITSVPQLTWKGTHQTFNRVRYLMKQGAIKIKHARYASGFLFGLPCVCHSFGVLLLCMFTLNWLWSCFSLQGCNSMTSFVLWRLANAQHRSARRVCWGGRSSCVETQSNSQENKRAVA